MDEAKRQSVISMVQVRHVFANIPVLSCLLLRWVVLFGSEIIDYGLTRRAADRRARKFVYAREVGLLTVERHCGYTHLYPNVDLRMGDYELDRSERAGTHGR